MKLRLFTDPKIEEDHIDIHCKEKNKTIEKIVDFIKDSSSPEIIGEKDGLQRPISRRDILYFESVDKKCFAYTKEDVFQVKATLLELEKHLSDTFMVRINKSTIVNLYKIESIKSDLNMRTIATLVTDEQLIITRRYKQSFNTSLFTLRNLLEVRSNEAL